MTRDALYEAAVELFVEHGYEATTMDDIAQRAVVSRATAFTYFPKKEDLLLEWAARRRQEIAVAANDDEGINADAPTQIKHAFQRLGLSYTRGASGRRFIEAWLGTGGPLKPEAWVSSRLLSEMVQAGQVAGTIRSDVKAQTAGRLLLNILLGALYQWAAEQRSGAWLHRELDAALDLVFLGLAAPPG
ncbi:MAG: TetR/AcrR family transcriptional regulator [Actinomycetota bacterium]|nr:TetR/AcrR family transcriptional regulator [Actinomycetota bacterium]